MAIYHYETYLKLIPDADNAVVVEQRIEACKQQLTANVLALPSMPAEQRRIEQLVAQNLQLRADLNRWSTCCARLMAARTNSSPAVYPGSVQPAQMFAAAPPAIARPDGHANPASRAATP